MLFSFWVEGESASRQLLHNGPAFFSRSRTRLYAYDFPFCNRRMQQHHKHPQPLQQRQFLQFCVHFGEYADYDEVVTPFYERDLFVFFELTLTVLF